MTDAPMSRMDMYLAGMNDRQIAKAEGVCRSAILYWRQRKGLVANTSRSSRLTAEENASRRLLYDFGWSDLHLAAHYKCDHTAIRSWRKTHGLQANFRVGERELLNARPTIADLVDKCRRSVGHYLPRDIAEDAVSDIIVDLLSGKLALDGIADAARGYGNRVIAAFASKWGARSLDAEIGDEAGFTLLDTIRDQSASSWLEEMGATMW